MSIYGVVIEEESEDYHACHFQCNDKKIIFRKSKITPKKIGQFVTLWKRNQNGIIEPFSFSDSFNFCIIETIVKNKIGYFLFTKEILNEQGILSGKHEGKRGFRIYPTWDQPNNKQGNVTQKWQSPFFITWSDHQIEKKEIIANFDRIFE
ncbi:MepB family protein [Leptospira sp. WS39.C2]